MGRLTEKDKEYIIGKNKAGWSHRQIAEGMHFSYKAAGNCLRNLSIGKIGKLR